MGSIALRRWRYRSIIVRMIGSSLAGALAVSGGAAYVRDAAAQPARTSIAVRVSPASGAPIASEALRDALERELAVRVVSAAPSTAPDASTSLVDVTWRSDGKGAEVVFRGPDGRAAWRAVDLPADVDLATATLVFAISNLVRDEASALLSRMRPAPASPPTEASSVADVPLRRSESAAAQAGAERAPKAFDPCAAGPATFLGADFFPFVGSSSVNPHQVRTLSFNLLGGYSRGLRGLELGVGVNIESAAMCGAQFAAAGNVVMGPARGLQLAPFNISLGRVEGAQIGVAGLVDGDLSGAQVATVGLVTGSATGLQFSVVNLAVGGLSGVQIGTANLALDAVRGVQIGVVNVTAGDVDGLQVGTSNIAGGAVSGTQIGVVNYADQSDYPIGVLSIVRRGATDLRAWSTESGILMAGVRHGGRVVRNTYGMGYSVRDGLAAMHLGIGVKVPLVPRLSLDMDLSESWHFGEHTGPMLLSTVQATLDYGVTSTFGLFAGPTFNVLVHQDKQRKLNPPWGSIQLHEWDDGLVRAWAGVTVGVRASL